MGARNWELRYRIARDYADDQAGKLRDGKEIRGWAYERDWKQGEPKPPTVSLIGAAWVARSYEVAADIASSLVSAKGKTWQGIHDQCKALADAHKENLEKPGYMDNPA